MNTLPAPLCMRSILTVGLVLALTGCAPYTLVKAGVHHTDAYSLSTPIEWNQPSGQRPTLWTVDGPGLEYLLHFRGVEDGAKIFDGLPDDLGQPFSADMRASEVADLFVESFALAWGATAVRLVRLRPAQFGSWSGFGFDLEFESAIGLSMKAVATGAVIDESLYLIVYAGARDYYFDKYLPYVQQIVESVSPRGRA